MATGETAQYDGPVVSGRTTDNGIGTCEVRENSRDVVLHQAVIGGSGLGISVLTLPRIRLLVLQGLNLDVCLFWEESLRRVQFGQRPVHIWHPADV